ncbi:MAG: thiamine-phosphate kinase [Rhodospirillales bacterium]|nr:thiamine-phosphate kinase [Alphaproteobacteria bacterium]MBL6947741.1 thiamine-phosphate kinase [Rhodospirillales bacterium]
MAADGKPDEFEMIARFFAPLAKGEAGALGLGDDAAVLSPPPNRELVVTADSLTSGVHFPIDENPRDVATRLIGVNLSDLAAMGADPWVYTLALALPEDWEPDWMEAFSDELNTLQERFGLHLVGGDTTATPGPMMLTLTALGTVAKGEALRRGGAESGDRIFVSGTIGDAALGLMVLKQGIEGLEEKHADVLLSRFHRPSPRVVLGRRLNGLATAAVDVSDGLIADMGHLARESGLAAELLSARIPLSDAAKAAISLDSGLMDMVLAGGDDYELLFTAPQEAAAGIASLAAELDLTLSEIGSISDGKGKPGEVRVLDENGQALAMSKKGYRHF